MWTSIVWPGAKPDEDHVERMLLVDRLVLDRDHDVAILEAGLLGGTARGDRREIRPVGILPRPDERALVDGQVLRRLELQVDGLVADPDVRPGQRLAGERPGS